MRFQVPQFIETESKIIGPFTVKQFLYIAAGGAVIFILRYVFSSSFLWFVFSIPVGALGLALAFVRLDGIPLPNYLVRALTFLTGEKKYLFRKDEDKNGQK